MRAILGLSILLVAAAAYAAPILPPITGHDFNFGAYNTDGTPEWGTHGAAPDTLQYTPNSLDHEVTAYWPNWPNQPVYPVWAVAGAPIYAGDFVLGVKFTTSDAPQGPLNVSLVGTGLNTAPGAADLQIYGTVYLPNQTLSGLLWALDLQNVALYGHAGQNAYGLDGVGTIVAGLVPQYFNLIGQTGAMRGHVDFVDAPLGWVPALYDPANPLDTYIRADFSGETGVLPEPATLILLLGGLGLLRRTR